MGTTLSYTAPKVSKRGQYFPTSARMMDTRLGTGVRKGVVNGGSSVSLPVAGHNGVPATGVSAAVFNVTVTGATASSYATVYPGGTTRPGTSNLNFRKGFTGANLVTVPLGANGAVRFYNNAGSVHFIADLVGYYSAAPTFSQSGGNGFYTTAPNRVFDSRDPNLGFGKIGSAEYFPLSLTFGTAEDARIRGFVFTLTSANATKPGVLSVTPTEPTGPATTSSLNYQPGPAVAEPRREQDHPGGHRRGELPDGLDRQLRGRGDPRHRRPRRCLRAGGGWRRGSALPPARTDPHPRHRRQELGAPSVGTGTETVVQAPVSVAGRDTWALAGNITGVLPTENTYLAIWGGGANPGTSSVNLTKGVTRANAAWTEVDVSNTYTVYNNAGRTNTLYDVSGSFEGWPASPATIAGIPWDPSSATARGSAAPCAGTARPEAPQPRDARLAERPAPKHL